MAQYSQRYGFPPFTPVIKNLIIINVIVWIAQSFLGNNISTFLDNTFALHSFYSPYFKVWQVLTYMFMHSPFGSSLGITHILFNMIGLWMFGSALETQLGSKRFLTFYLLCGIGAGIIYVLYLQYHLAPAYHTLQLLQSQGDTNSELFAQDYSEINDTIIGASGAVYGVMTAFAYLFPNTYLYFYFLIPVKTKWAIILLLGYEVYGVIANNPSDNVGHVAHLGGALVGFLLIYFWNKKDRKHFY